MPTLARALGSCTGFASQTDWVCGDESEVVQPHQRVQRALIGRGGWSWLSRLAFCCIRRGSFNSSGSGRQCGGASGQGAPRACGRSRRFGVAALGCWSDAWE